MRYYILLVTSALLSLSCRTTKPCNQNLVYNTVITESTSTVMVEALGINLVRPDAIYIENTEYKILGYSDKLYVCEDTCQEMVVIQLWDKETKVVSIYGKSYNKYYILNPKP